MESSENLRTALTGCALECGDRERLGGGAARLLHLEPLERPAVVAPPVLEAIEQHAFILLDVRRRHLLEAAHLHCFHSSRIGV